MIHFYCTFIKFALVKMFNMLSDDVIITLHWHFVSIIYNTLCLYFTMEENIKLLLSKANCYEKAKEHRSCSNIFLRTAPKTSNKTSHSAIQMLNGYVCQRVLVNFSISQLLPRIFAQIYWIFRRLWHFACRLCKNLCLPCTNLFNIRCCIMKKKSYRKNSSLEKALFDRIAHMEAW